MTSESHERCEAFHDVYWRLGHDFPLSSGPRNRGALKPSTDPMEMGYGDDIQRLLSETAHYQAALDRSGRE